MESLFTADPLAEKKTFVIKGEVPSPFNLPKGCVFENRCEFAREICRVESPELLEISPDILSAIDGALRFIVSP